MLFSRLFPSTNHRSRATVSECWQYRSSGLNAARSSSSPARNRRAAQRARHHHMVGAAGSVAAGSCGANRTAKLRAYTTAAAGCPTRHRSTCPLPWKRAQGPMHTVALRCGRTPRPLARATASGADNAGLPNRPRRPREFGRPSKARGPAHQERRERVPFLAAKESDAAHPQAHHGDGSPASRGGHHSDRSLMRS